MNRFLLILLILFKHVGILATRSYDFTQIDDFNRINNQITYENESGQLIELSFLMMNQIVNELIILSFNDKQKNKACYFSRQKWLHSKWKGERSFVSEEWRQKAGYLLDNIKCGDQIARIALLYSNLCDADSGRVASSHRHPNLFGSIFLSVGLCVQHFLLLFIY